MLVSLYVSTYIYMYVPAYTQFKSFGMYTAVCPDVVVSERKAHVAYCICICMYADTYMPECSCIYACLLRGHLQPAPLSPALSLGLQP